MKKYYVCCDMEGITGISNFKEMETQNAYVSKMMTAEISALCESINRNSTGERSDSIDILVADSHATGTNINHSDLSENARLIRGFPRAQYMAPGIDSSFDAMFIAGHHARAGTLKAGMDHTFSGSAIYSVEVNGSEIGEFELNAGLAGHYKVPVAYVSGDDKFIEQISVYKEKLGFETLTTKEAVARYSAVLEHPKRVYSKIDKAVEKTLREKKWAGKYLTFEYPLKVKITLLNTVKADMAALIPVIKRLDGRTIYFEAPDFVYFYDMFCAITLICWNDR
ncbi:MAG TPA: M55 family metallopeptidase [Candidatus Wallbacteria bacterium]|nr:MAG: D-aminopeptidase [bacterium ADurb.Bin243]HOD41075.1 M55 family metallopeptidase [Candidatus Wallbacteria bacterium]HPG57642.1 M55 family metallopeptidase [Candidatus Wallbacteria bacterium]